MSRKRVAPEDAALLRASEVLTEPAISAKDLRAEYETLTKSYEKILRKFQKTLVISDSYQAQHIETASKLEDTTQKYRQLRDVALPICMYCKKIRSDDDYWQRLETFFCNHADIMFSHGVCPDCVKTAYRKMGIKTEKPLLAERAKRKKAGYCGHAPDEDDTLREMRAMIRQSAFDGSPLTPQTEKFAAEYGKLLRRFNKILSISDSYQSQMMELNSRQEVMARTDLLTGLANRWEMVARLESEQKRAKRHGKVFSILLADIDHFKQVNDKHGHLCGDRVLRALAELFSATIRSEDTCCRWGGEEFLFVLPETDLEQAGFFAEKILSEVRKLAVPWDSEEIKVTMSIGYEAFTTDMSIDECIQVIDKALYQSKKSGRDRATAAGD